MAVIGHGVDEPYFFLFSTACLCVFNDENSFLLCQNRHTKVEGRKRGVITKLMCCFEH